MGFFSGVVFVLASVCGEYGGGLEGIWAALLVCLAWRCAGPTHYYLLLFWWDSCG